MLSPELVLLVASLVLLALDAVRPRQKEKPWLPYVALAGLAASLAASISLWGRDGVVLSVLAVDAFALVVKMVALVSLGLVVLNADAFVRARITRQGEFYTLLLLSGLAICLLSGARNLVLIFLAFDFLSITSYVLTGYLRDEPRSAEAAIKYFLYGAALSAVMLFGMSWLYGVTGSTDLAGIAVALQGAESSLRPLLLPALVMLLAGFAFKVGGVPFHQWAPDVYEGAPTPVTAFISVGPKLAGFAIIVRVMLTALPAELGILSTDWRSLLMGIAVLTMTVGNMVALWQTNIKRLLAYSSIAQAGYMLIGVAAASPLGVTAVALYLATYALTNLGAFGAVIAFSNQVGSDEIEDYAGLSRRAPSMALVLIICLLSLAGIPGTAGFLGKLLVFSAAIEEGLVWLALIGVLNSVISLGYYWKIIRAMYLTPARTDEKINTTPALATVLVACGVGVIAVFVLAHPLISLIENSARSFFGS
jgi:NADH-quinone oxidoreductase subunit N